MRPAENIEKLIKKLRFKPSAQARQRMLTNVMQALDNHEKQKSADLQPNIWRIVMKTKIIKFTVAAVIIIAMVLSIILLDKSVTPAYGIEQTIEAFKKVNAVYVEQIFREKGILLNIKMWARRGSHGKFFFGDFRRESGNNGDTTVVNESENRTYFYNPSAKTVRIYERLNVTIGNFLDEDYFLHLQQEMENVELEYGKDKITGKEVVILKYKVPIPSEYDKSVSKSEVITFDLETKLPIRWTSWDNSDFKGEPYSEWTLIEYNPKLSEDFFKFEIPEDANVIKEPSK